MGHDKKLVERLCEENYQKVYSFFIFRGFTPDEAQDLTQKVFLRVVLKVDTYRGGSPTAWVMSVTRTIWKNHLRDKSTLKAGKPTLTLDDPEHPIDASTEKPLFGPGPGSPESAAFSKEWEEELGERIRDLPARKRRAIMLRVEGLTYREIAAVMECSVEAARKLLYNARKTLREDAQGGEPVGKAGDQDE